MYRWSACFLWRKCQKSTALLATFLWSMGFFCFGVSWFKCQHSSIWWRFPWCELSLGWLTFGLPCTLSNAFHLFSAAFSGAKCGHLCRDLDIDWILRGWVFTGFHGYNLVILKSTVRFTASRRFLVSRGLTFFTVWASAVIFNLIFSLSKNNGI